MHETVSNTALMLVGMRFENPTKSISIVSVVAKKLLHVGVLTERLLASSAQTVVVGCIALGTIIPAGLQSER